MNDKSVTDAVARQQHMGLYEYVSRQLDAVLADATAEHPPEPARTNVSLPRDENSDAANSAIAEPAEELPELFSRD